ncbi:MAG: hypothetical protein P1V36_00225 [Planctomycetota bacterium]|nr:hypothetical protein [Planctomycetota bacterium]
MPYLKTLSKRAGEPLRPSGDAEVEPVVTVAEGSDEEFFTPDYGEAEEVLPSAGATAEQPKDPTKKALFHGVFDVLDRSLKDGDARKALYTKVAADTGHEFVKGVRRLSEDEGDGGGLIEDLTLAAAAFPVTRPLAALAKSAFDPVRTNDISDYMIRGESGDEATTTRLRDAKVSDEVKAELEKSGRQALAVRGARDIVTDSVMDHLRAAYVSEADSPEAGKARFDAQMERWRALKEKSTGEKVTTREMEHEIAFMVDQRLGGAVQGEGPLMSIARSSVKDTGNLVEATLVRNMAAAQPLLSGDDETDRIDPNRILESEEGLETVLPETTAERAERLIEEVGLLAPQVIEDQIRQGNLDYTLVPNFSDMTTKAVAETGAAPTTKNSVAVTAGDAQALATPMIQELLHKEEGFRGTVYDDLNPQTNNGPITAYGDALGTPTIGYGHAISADERDRFEKYLSGGEVMSKEDAVALFFEDVDEHQTWLPKIKKPVTPEMITALTSLAFNAGPNHPDVGKVINAINEGDYQKASEALRDGVATSKGKFLQGLKDRRGREADLFLSGGLPTEPVEGEVTEVEAVDIDSDIIDLGSGDVEINKFEEMTGTQMTEVEGGFFAAMKDLDDYGLKPATGSQSWMRATKALRVIQENNPETYDKLKGFGDLPSGQGFYALERELQRDFQTEMASRRRGGEEIDPVKERAQLRARTAEVIASARTEGLWATPSLVSRNYLMGIDEVPEELGLIEAAVTPLIEIVGAVDDEVIYRQESAAMVTLNALDAAPILGQSYNLGVLENYVAPAAMEFYEDPSVAAAASLGLKTAALGSSLSVVGQVALRASGEMTEMHAAGVRGVTERSNLVEFSMDMSSRFGEWAVTSDAGEAVLTAAVKRDLVPFIPDGLTAVDERQRVLAATDVVRAGYKLAGVPIGFAAAVAHPDLLLPLSSTIGAVPDAIKAYRGLSKVEKAGEALGRTKLSEINAVGLERMAATLNTLTSLSEAAHVDEVGEVNAEALGQLLRAMDNSDASLARGDDLDAALREVSPHPMKTIDRASEEFVGTLAQNGNYGAKAAIDPQLSSTVFLVAEDVIAAAKASGDPEKVKLAEEAAAAMDRLGLGQALTLTPKTADLRVKDAVGADKAFNTRDRVLVLRRTLQLLDDVEDGRGMRERVFQGRLLAPIESIGNTKVTDIEGMPRGMTTRAAVDVLGPVSDETLEAGLKTSRMGDAAKAEVREKLKTLREWHSDFTKAIDDNTILDKDVNKALRQRFEDLGIASMTGRLFEGPSTGARYRQVVKSIRGDVSAVSGASPMRAKVAQGLAGVLTYNYSRGRAMQEFARAMVDEDALKLAGLSVDAFLDPNGGAHRLRRFAAAVQVGGRETVMNFLGGLPGGSKVSGDLSRSAVSQNSARAAATQMLADGQDEWSTATAIQNAVARKLRARHAALVEGGDEARALEVWEQAQEVAKPEWQETLVQWMHRSADEYNRARDAGETPNLDEFELPVGIDPSILRTGDAEARPTAAVKAWVDDVYDPAYGKMPPKEATDPELTPTAKQGKRTTRPALSAEDKKGVTAILDNMVRYMAGVTSDMSKRQVEAVVGSWLDDNIKNVRRVGGETQYRKQFDALRGEFETMVEDRVRELVGDGPVTDAARRTAQLDALDSILPVMTEAEAIILTGSYKDFIQDAILTARFGDEFEARRLFQGAGSAATSRTAQAVIQAAHDGREVTFQQQRGATFQVLQDIYGIAERAVAAIKNKRKKSDVHTLLTLERLEGLGLDADLDDAMDIEGFISLVAKMYLDEPDRDVWVKSVRDLVALNVSRRHPSEYNRTPGVGGRTTRPSGWGARQPDTYPARSARLDVKRLLAQTSAGRQWWRAARPTLGGVTQAADVRRSEMFSNLGTRSPLFVKWFEGSKVVDDSGRAAPMWLRGTTPTGEAAVTDGPLGRGVYGDDALTERRIFSNGEDDPAGAAYMRLENPLEVPAMTPGDGWLKYDSLDVGYELQSAVWERLMRDKHYRAASIVLDGKKVKIHVDHPEIMKALSAEAREAGHDGIIVKSSLSYHENGSPVVYFAFDKNAVKIADGNAGFDPSDARILFQAAENPYAEANRDILSGLAAEAARRREVEGLPVSKIPARKLPRDPEALPADTHRWPGEERDALDATVDAARLRADVSGLPEAAEITGTQAATKVERLIGKSRDDERQYFYDLIEWLSEKAERDAGVNIGDFRRMAPEGMTDDEVKKVYKTFMDEKVIVPSKKKGRRDVSPEEVAKAQTFIDALIYDMSEEGIIESLDVAGRVSRLDLDSLTRPETIKDAAVRDVVEKLKKYAPQELDDMVEARAPTFTAEVKKLEKELRRVEQFQKDAVKSLKDLKDKRKRTLRQGTINRYEQEKLRLRDALDRLKARRDADAEAHANLGSVAAEARARKATSDGAGGVGGPPPGAAGDAPLEGSNSNAKGMAYFLSDGSALLYAFKNADASTGLHEMAHVMRRNLRQTHLETTLDWANDFLEAEGLSPVRLNAQGNFEGEVRSVINAEELFAEGFERYLREGVAPTSALEKVFSVIRGLMAKIYSAITDEAINVEISDEMYNVFDEIFGAQRKLTLDQLPEVQRYLDFQRASEGGEMRRGGRIVEQSPVEETAVDHMRQTFRSLDDYRARFGMPYGDPKTDLTQGPGAETHRSKPLGPVSRRALSLGEVSERMGKDPSQWSAKERALAFADKAAIGVASGVQAVAFGLFFGGDAERAYRALPVAARSHLRGPMRELEEMLADLSMLTVDSSRLVGDQRERAVSNIVKFFRGASVQMQTGAQRGRRTKSAFVDSEQHLIRLFTRVFDAIDDESLKALDVDAEAVLAKIAGADRVPGHSSSGALSGLWQGYRVSRPEVSSRTSEAFAGGLVISDDTRARLQVVEGSTESVPELFDDTLGNIFKALTGQNLGKGGLVPEEAQKVAALMVFHAGGTQIRKGGEVFTAADLRAGAYGLDAIYNGSVVTKNGVTVEIPGLLKAGVSPDKAMPAFLMMGVSGYTHGLYQDMRVLGMGLNAGDAKAYMRYVAGNAAVMTTAEVDRAKAVAKNYGLNARFTVSPDSVGDFYIPETARDELAARMQHGMRQVGAEGQDKPLMQLMGAVYGYQLQNLIYGTVGSRQSFKLMSTQDLGIQLGIYAGGAAGAAAATRVGALTVLSAGLPGSAGLVSMERAADIADLGKRVYDHALNKGGPIVEAAAFKASFRAWAAKNADEATAAATEFLSRAKHRVEVAPILENQDHMLAIGGRVYNAQNLRRVFTRAGLYSNSFKEMKSLFRENFSNTVDRDRLSETVGLSGANRQFLDSADETAQGFFASGDAKRMGRRTASSVFEHGVESADAWADLERTGAAVTLMEMGYDPEAASRVVVEAIYDYRGSMTDGDRHWLRRILMPFWAFRKNANTQAANLVATPRGAYMATALMRATRFGAEAATHAVYETILGPYGVNVTAMEPATLDAYYDTRLFLEFGEPEPTPEILEAYRASLPDEDKSISDEALLEYDFDGWTIKEGYGGYSKVPEHAKRALRGLLASKYSIDGGGRYKGLRSTMASSEAMAEFAKLGAEMSVRDEASRSALPGWVRLRPTVQVPVPVLTEDLEVSLRRGMGDSLYFMMPDNFMMSAIDHASATFATMYLGGQIALEGVREVAGDPEANVTKADGYRMLNAFAPIVDVRDYGSPFSKLLFSAVEYGTMERAPRVRLDPRIARLIEGSSGFELEHEGERVNSPGTAFAYKTFAGAASAAGSIFAGVEVDESARRAFARPVKVEVIDGKRTIVPYEGVSYDGTASEFTDDSRTVGYTPYLSGMGALYFEYTPLGQVNKFMLKHRDTTLEQAMSTDPELRNAVLELLGESARVSGIGVLPADRARAAKMGKPYINLK